MAFTHQVYYELLRELLELDTVSPFRDEQFSSSAHFLSRFGFERRQSFFTKGSTNAHLWVYTHLDTKPPNPREDWNSNPFSLTVQKDKLIGLGISDAKFQLLNVLSLMQDELADAFIIIDTQEECNGSECSKFLSQYAIDTLLIVDGFGTSDQLAFNGLLGQFDGHLTIKTGMSTSHPARRNSSFIFLELEKLFADIKSMPARFQITGLQSPATVRSLTTETVDVRFDIRYEYGNRDSVLTFINKYGAHIRQDMPPVSGYEKYKATNKISEDSLPFSCNLGVYPLNARFILVVPGAEPDNRNHLPNEFVYERQITKHFESLKEVVRERL